MKFLNKKELKRIRNILMEKHKLVLPDDIHMALDEDDLFVVSKDVDRISLQDLNVKRIGLLLGKFEYDCVVLTKDAAHLFLP